MPGNWPAMWTRSCSLRYGDDRGGSRDGRRCPSRKRKATVSSSWARCNGAAFTIAEDASCVPTQSSAHGLFVPLTIGNIALPRSQLHTAFPGFRYDAQRHARRGIRHHDHSDTAPATSRRGSSGLASISTAIVSTGYVRRPERSRETTTPERACRPFDIDRGNLIGEAAALIW